MRMTHVPECCTSQTIMYHPERNSGLGVTVTSVRLGTATLPMRMVRISSLMAGVYTENQPDFTWLMPFEEKSFTQYFLPYRELGIVKNASKDLLMNIDRAGEGKVRLKVFATSEQDVVITLYNGEESLYSETLTMSPVMVYDKEITSGDAEWSNLRVVISDAKGKELLVWEPEPDEIRPIPDAAEAALRPEEIKTVEQLYLT